MTTDKPKRGRPKTEHGTRKEYIRIPLHLHEKEAIERAANNEPPTTYAREVLLKAAGCEPHKAGDGD